MASIIHRGGQFVADTGFGTVVRTTEYPDFVYHHPDGRTTRHPIGYGHGHGRRDSYLGFIPRITYMAVEAEGVRLYTPHKTLSLFPWE